MPRLVAAGVLTSAGIDTKRAPETTEAIEAASTWWARRSPMPTVMISTPSRGIALSHSTVRRGSMLSGST